MADQHGTKGAIQTAGEPSPANPEAGPVTHGTARPVRRAAVAAAPGVAGPPPDQRSVARVGSVPDARQRWRTQHSRTLNGW